jgi:hypothetical protein
MAICRYIINRSDKKELMGKNLADEALINNMVGLLIDLRKEITTLVVDE